MRMDRDGDGKISIDEFNGPPKRFKKIDKNGDHYLTADEFAVSGAHGGRKKTAHRRSKTDDTSATAPINGSSRQSSAGESQGQQLSGAEIRHDVIGNTLDFVVPGNGKHLYVYFAPDGGILERVGKAPKVLKKQWFINQKDMLCRTYGPKNKRQCVKVTRTNDPHSMMMANARFMQGYASGR